MSTELSAHISDETNSPRREYNLIRGSADIGNNMESPSLDVSGELTAGQPDPVVIPLFEMTGNLDASFGNIDFDGNVKIHGNVLPGARILATGTVEVDGFTDRCVIEACGDVRIGGNRAGGEDSEVVTYGSFSAHAILDADVKALGDVCVENVIINSQVSAGGTVTAGNPGEGCISGGRVMAGSDVTAFHFGASTQIPTLIDIGCIPHSEWSENLKINLIRHYLDSHHRLFSEIGGMKFQHAKTPLNSRQFEFLYALESRARRLRGKICDLKWEQTTFIAKKRDTKSSPAVRVNGVIHKGVSIVSRHDRMEITGAMEAVVIREGDGKLTAESFHK